VAEGRRIAIIGAGVVGTSTALFLQADGHDVTLIDPREPGSGTSSGNAGIISPGSCIPVATPGTLKQVPAMLLDPTSPLAVRWSYLPRLIPWLLRFVLASRPAQVEATQRALLSLVSRAAKEHDVLIQRIGAGDLVHRVGWLKVASSAASLRAHLGSDIAVYERLGVAHQVLAEGDSLEMEPALHPRLRHGLFMPVNRAIRHPQRYVERFAATFLAEGGRHLAASATGLRRQDGRVRAVETERGPVEADHVVLCAGALSRRLAAEGGARVPLDAERGYHAMLPHPARTLSRPVYLAEHHFVLAPMEHGIRLTGGVEMASPTAPPDWRRLRRLVPIARDALPGLDGEVQSEWLGFRPSTPDSRPVLGRAPDLANLWLAFGHQHIGMTLGPVTGRIVADLIAGRDPGVDLAPFRPERRYW
jgi:D-amino-acid dehydrogenase